MLEKDHWRSKESSKDWEVLGQVPSESWVLSAHTVPLLPLPLVPPHGCSPAFIRGGLYGLSKSSFRPRQTWTSSASEYFKTWMVRGVLLQHCSKIYINQNQSVCVEKWIHCNFIRERNNAPKIALSSHALMSKLSAILGLSFFELPNFE